MIAENKNVVTKSVVLPLAFESLSNEAVFEWQPKIPSKKTTELPKFKSTITLYFLSTEISPNTYINKN